MSARIIDMPHRFEPPRDGLDEDAFIAEGSADDEVLDAERHATLTYVGPTWRDKAIDAAWWVVGLLAILFTFYAALAMDGQT